MADLYVVLNFLGDFSPVSIRMAKDQNLSLNPTKISGVCGRLMCCLNYEDDLYKKGGDLYVKKDRTPSPRDVEPPGIGKEVVTDEGYRQGSQGKIIINIRLRFSWRQVEPSI